MLTIAAVTQYLESIAPLSYQAGYDNAGLLVGSPQTQVSGILVTLDVTPKVLEEAKAHQCNLIITHHPPIFQPIRQLSDQGFTTQVITFAIQHQIALYAIHTNLDHLPNGVNQTLGHKIGLQDLRILQPIPKPQPDPGYPIGAGMIGQLPTPLSPDRFLAHLQQKLQLACIRYTFTSQTAIEQVAICGGSGSFLIPVARARNAHAFVTADLKYHQCFQSDAKMMLADIGHYESEIGTQELLYQLLSTKFTNIALRQASTITNPIRYYV